LNNQSKGAKNDSWEQMGAASGLLAGVLFVISFIVFLTTDPGGTPRLPNIENAQQAPAFLAAHLSEIRVELLLNGLGIVLFLWFLGTLLPRLRAAEGEPARGSTIAALGAVVGSALLLAGFALTATTALSTSPSQAETVPALYTAAALLVAFGGGVFSLFFLGVAEVILRTQAMAKWLGIVTLAPAVLCLLAFMTPFFSSGALNAATGALGLYAWYAAGVLWLFLASGMMTLDEHRRRSAGQAAPPLQPASGTEGAL
jgi:hypothetical protein